MEGFPRDMIPRLWTGTTLNAVFAFALLLLATREGTASNDPDSNDSNSSNITDEDNDETETTVITTTTTELPYICYPIAWEWNETEGCGTIKYNRPVVLKKWGQAWVHFYQDALVVRTMALAFWDQVLYLDPDDSARFRINSTLRIVKEMNFTVYIDFGQILDNETNEVCRPFFSPMLWRGIMPVVVSTILSTTKAPAKLKKQKDIGVVGNLLPTKILGGLFSNADYSNAEDDEAAVVVHSAGKTAGWVKPVLITSCFVGVFLLALLGAFEIRRLRRKKKRKEEEETARKRWSTNSKSLRRTSTVGALRLGARKSSRYSVNARTSFRRKSGIILARSSSTLGSRMSWFG